MRTTTLEELLMKEDDSVLLDVYEELDSCVVPATGYAHAYCRKVNKLINAGQLCTVRDKYRNVYLPTLSKLIFKEMARRYYQVLYNQKTISEDTGVQKCHWCSEVFDKSEMHLTDLGTMCEHCITAIHSRGEQVTVYD